MGQVKKPEPEVIKDYFIPDVSKNAVEFRSTDGVVTKYYLSKKDSFDIFTVKVSENDTDTSIYSETYQFKNNEVRMLHSVSSSRVLDYDILTLKNDYNPPAIVLKFPAMGKDESWINTDSLGKQKLSSSWTTVTIDGEQKKAIRVLNRIWGMTYSEKFEYYVKGIGLWKITASDGSDYTYLEVDNLYYDPHAEQISFDLKR